jgi:cardiolipin synthase
VIDGRLVFTGGAGVADWWLKPVHGPTWRDTMARIEGPVAAAMQGTFAENWLEACGEILTGPRHWPTIERAGPAGAMVVKSSPADRATASRVVFQMLIEGAVTSIDISTPYFLPDRSFRRALVARRAAWRAGARGRAGPITDQRWVAWLAAATIASCSTAVSTCSSTGRR